MPLLAKSSEVALLESGFLPSRSRGTLLLWQIRCVNVRKTYALKTPTNSWPIVSDRIEQQKKTSN
jgi:hypothetical protein